MGGGEQGSGVEVLCRAAMFIVAQVILAALLTHPYQKKDKYLEHQNCVV